SNLNRFIQEAKAASSLNHPNILVIYEIGQSDDAHFIVSEFIKGKTLREIFKAKTLKLSEVLDISIQIAGALCAAHEARLVHRDIKPENVMIRPDGYVKILDFGLAKLVEQKNKFILGLEESTVRQNQTAKGVILGTVNYMSPEQAKGERVDQRTDIFSLGVVIYEMLAGRTPFAGDSVSETFANLINAEPQPLSRFASNLPDELQRIVAKMLSKNRDDRYQTMKDILTDLKDLRENLTLDEKLEKSRSPDAGNATAILQATTGDANLQTNETQDSFSQTIKRHKSLATFALVALLVGAIGLGYYFFSAGKTASGANGKKIIQSLAVLPLENLSGDTSQDYFADGMTEALITDLAKVGALRVISLPSVMQYKGARKPLPEIGRELNADVVLTGSVVRSGERVRIAVQLINTATGRNLWADSYERDLRDVLALQREVIRDIVGEIRIELTPQEQGQFGSVRPVNPEAYDHYLRGRFYLNRQKRDGNEAAIMALERAVATDPTFAAAYAELSQAYVWKLFLFAPEEGQLAEKAFVTAEKALSLDPNLALAYLARGRILWTPANHFPHEKAIREYRRALTLNPNLDEARNQLALVYGHIGAFDEALQESHKAITTNPHNNLAQFRIGETLNFQGKYEDALSVLRAIPQEVNPELVGVHIAWALFNLGRKDEASAVLEQLLKDYPEDRGGLFTSVQAVLAASAGQEQRVEDKIKLAVERGKGFGHFHHTAYHIACAYALMNKPEQAIKWLEVTAEEGFPCYPLFVSDANLDTIRQNPKFQSFLSAQKQEWEYYKSLSQL
ncbi:MAG: protein kinase, partial [Acidobacteriota bacterium]|nr:protein kinase [Acidobacteriota bacterium]